MSVKLKTLLFLFLSFYAFSFFSSNTHKIGPAPKWINKITFSKTETIPFEQISSGMFYMLFDKQVNLNTNEIYHHYAYKVTSEAGVQGNSELSLSFEPSFQTLTLHNIKVYRKNAVIEKLSNSKISTIQRESGLEEHLYDAALSTVIILQDIRPGDIIEYDYTITGFNPVFKNKYYDWFYTATTNEILTLYERYIFSADRTLKFQSNLTDNIPEEVNANGNKELIWHKRKVPAIAYAENLPYWYEASPYVEISEFRSWEEVEEWSKELFSEALSSSGPLIKQKASEIKKKYKEKNDQLIAALRFVQDQVRYLGFEFGENSHRPHNPNQIIKQLSGDCKDKSVLLCKLLQEMDIESYPALVNSRSGKAIPTQLPSPFSFNHCIAVVKLSTDVFWFDPTASYQRGTLYNTYSPHYYCGLIVGNDSLGVQRIREKKYSEKLITETYDIKNLTGDASLNVRSVYSGEDADDMRFQIAGTSFEDLQKSYFDFYKTTYSDMSSAKDIEIIDDTINNEITLVENYDIRNFWKKDTLNDLQLSAFVYPDQINDKLKSISGKLLDRIHPLYLSYPVKINQRIVVKFPEAWNVKDNTNFIKTDEFDFESVTKYNSDTHTAYLNYKFETLNDHVPVEKINDFVAKIQKVKDDLGLSITYNKKTGSKIRNFDKKVMESVFERVKTVLICGLIFLLLVGAFLIYFFVIRKK